MVKMTPSHAVLRSRLFWILPFIAPEVISLQQGLNFREGVGVMLALGMPQLTVLLLLRALGIREIVLLGAALVLALQPLAALLTVRLFDPVGLWWWLYALTVPGAIVGCVLLVVYEKRMKTATPRARALASCCLLALPILANIVLVFLII
jgi:hypothetical protein